MDKKDNELKHTSIRKTTVIADVVVIVSCRPSTQYAKVHLVVVVSTW